MDHLKFGCPSSRGFIALGWEVDPVPQSNGMLIYPHDGHMSVTKPPGMRDDSLNFETDLGVEEGAVVKPRSSESFRRLVRRQPFPDKLAVMAVMAVF